MTPTYRSKLQSAFFSFENILFKRFSVSLFAKADAKISGLFLTFQIKFEKVLLYFLRLFNFPKVPSSVTALRFYPVNLLSPSRAFRDWECKGKISFYFRNAFLKINLKKFFKLFLLEKDYTSSPPPSCFQLLLPLTLSVLGVQR